MAVIYWAGDSTVQYNSILTYPQTGIGQVFHLFVRPEVRIENHAKNGRSTKSFLDEGRFSVICDRIEEGDFLFIQFGHNDEKKQDPARYTEPAVSFTANLERFVAAARERKAFPVLITPVERRCFGGDGRLQEGEHGDYVAAMKQAAKRWKVPLIDLCAMSRDKLVEAGNEKTKEWYMHLPAGQYVSHPEGLTDNTHLKYEGAVTYAGCIARGLKELGGIYEALLLDGLDY